MLVKNLNLTHIKINLPHGAKSGPLLKAYNEAGVEAAWAETAWAKRLEAKKARKNLTDFDRFKVKILKQRRTRLIKKAKDCRS